MLFDFVCCIFAVLESNRYATKQMKYPNVKKVKINNTIIAKAFKFSSVKSFNRTSARKRYMEGVDELIGIVIENIKSKI